MRIGLVQVTQETSSFNPTLTTLADFESFGIYEGDEILERLPSAGLVGGGGMHGLRLRPEAPTCL